jgi:hypothetical protein
VITITAKATVKGLSIDCGTSNKKQEHSMSTPGLPGPPPPFKPKTQAAPPAAGGLVFGTVQLKKTSGPVELSNAEKIAAEAIVEKAGNFLKTPTSVSPTSTFFTLTHQLPL